MKTETPAYKNKVSSPSSNTNNSLKQEDEEEELRRGPWTLEEDNLLIHYVACQGEGRWNLLAKSAGLKRTGKSCRLRWLNYLKPDIKRGNLTPQEQLLILELHSKWGNRWSKIAAHLPGRTDNEIKNYWRTRVQKHARQLNMESNSQSFMDAIRCFYMPRLVQKIEQSSALSPPPTTTTLNSEVPTDNTKDISTSSNSSSLSIMPLFSDQLTSSSSPDYGKVVNSSPKGNYPVPPDEINYHVVESVSFDMDQASTSASDIPFSDCHLAEPDWLECDMEDDGLWDLDELWQFRK